MFQRLGLDIPLGCGAVLVQVGSLMGLELKCWGSKSLLLSSSLYMCKKEAQEKLVGRETLESRELVILRLRLNRMTENLVCPCSLFYPLLFFFFFFTFAKAKGPSAVQLISVSSSGDTSVAHTDGQRRRMASDIFTILGHDHNVSILS